MAARDIGDGAMDADDGVDATGSGQMTMAPQPPRATAHAPSKVPVLVKKKRVKSPVEYTVPVVPVVEKPNWKRKIVRVAKKRTARSIQRESGVARGGDAATESDVSAGRETEEQDSRGAPNGLVIDSKGDPIDHSYLGTREDFDAYADKYKGFTSPVDPVAAAGAGAGSDDDVRIPLAPGSTGVASAAHGHLLIYQRMLELRDEHALCNWTQHNEVWKKQQQYLARRLNTSIDELVMSRSEEYREIVEERLVIERAIPILEKGLGDFWRTNLQIGSALTGLSMPVTKSERGEPPEILHVGKPRIVHQEQNYQSRNNLNYPWKDSVYLADRRRQLRELLDAIDPHAPQISELQVVASGLTDVRALKSMLDVAEADNDGAHAPAATGGGTAAGEGRAKRGPGLEVQTLRIVLEAVTGMGTQQSVSIYNPGTVALRYCFVQAEERSVGTTPTLQPKNQRSCFYFDPNERIILPGETVKMSFYFKSQRSGIFTEQWNIVTSPPIKNGAPIGPITLRGIATEDDLLKDKRVAIEQMLEARAPKTFIGRFVRDLIDIVPIVARTQRLSKMGKTPVLIDSSTEAEFKRQNADLNVHFHRDVVNLIVELAEEAHGLEVAAEGAKEAAAASGSVFLTDDDSCGAQAGEEQASVFKWNHSLNGLNEMLLEASAISEDQREGLLKRFNVLVAKLHTPVREPIRDDLYTDTARLVCQMVEGVAGALDGAKQGPTADEPTLDAASDDDGEAAAAAEALAVEGRERTSCVHAHVLECVRRFVDIAC